MESHVVCHVLCLPACSCCGDALAAVESMSISCVGSCSSVYVRSPHQWCGREPCVWGRAKITIICVLQMQCQANNNNSRVSTMRVDRNVRRQVYLRHQASTSRLQPLSSSYQFFFTVRSLRKFRNSGIVSRTPCLCPYEVCLSNGRVQ